MANGGETAYTVKEILAAMDARITARLDKIDSKLDAKASVQSVERLERLVAKLDKEAVRREGPIIDELRKFEQRVEVLEDTALNPERVRAILGDALKVEKTESWDSRTKLIALVIGLLTIMNFLLNFLSLGPDVVK